MPVLVGLIGELYQTSKDEMTQIVHIFFQLIIFNIAYP